MYAFIGLLFVIALINAIPQGAHVYNAEGNCLENFQTINRDFVEEIKRTRKLPENPSTDFKCFIACVGKKLQVMSHQGDFHFDELKKLVVDVTGGHATHDDAHTMVSKCIEVEHEDDCEKAYQYLKCKIDEIMPYRFTKDFCPTC